MRTLFRRSSPSPHLSCTILLRAKPSACFVFGVNSAWCPGSQRPMKYADAIYLLLNRGIRVNFIAFANKIITKGGLETVVLTSMQAIKWKCQKCSGFNNAEVHRCFMSNRAFRVYRMGPKPAKFDLESRTGYHFFDYLWLEDSRVSLHQEQYHPASHNVFSISVATRLAALWLTNRSFAYSARFRAKPATDSGAWPHSDIFRPSMQLQTDARILEIFLCNDISICCG
jgi:hypothetical protein